ncbi:hypothetical protein B0H19DRAFT_1134079 [Mycena capillaripes]|nr:hypothetical protein B0H19DRAFT_1134079 [Mycena capillaripes]
MTCTLNSTIDDLPDEVLAAILKLVTDFPVLLSDRNPPAPVSASRVSRRWRAVALGSAELWTTIRLSHHSRSWSWAALFARRSRSYPLDISINLESYIYEGRIPDYPAPIPLAKAIAIVGPHISRWRTLALRGWDDQVYEFCEFLGRSPGAASQLESLHLSTVKMCTWSELPPLSGLLDCQSFHSLKVNFRLNLDDLTAFRAVHTLDIMADVSQSFHAREFRQVLGPSSPLTTLVIRNFFPKSTPGLDPIDASTIRSLAISFSVPFYYHADYNRTTEGFESLTNTFSLPNLESLEILGGFSGARLEDDETVVPEDWALPLFPQLRNLRLEEVGFSRSGLAFIQHFSCSITDLQLIYTTGNERLLEHRHGGEPAWPSLRALTVETRSERVVSPEWLASFISMRSALGPYMWIKDLTIPPWPTDVSLAVEPAPAIHWQRSGPSPALMDGVYSCGFYVDEYDMRVADFEHVRAPPPRSACHCCGSDYDDYWEDRYWYYLEINLEILEKEIAEDFKIAGERVRERGMRRELRRESRRKFKVARKPKDGQRRRVIIEDFWVL